MSGVVLAAGGSPEQVYLEEERGRVLARVDELKHRVTELEQQLQESRQEVRSPRNTSRLRAPLTASLSLPLCFSLSLSEIGRASCRERVSSPV